MPDISRAGTHSLGTHTVKRMGYGAMQLSGPGIFGPPEDPEMAVAVLREAIEAGVNHIDTSDFYGPHVTNRLIREALHDLLIVTKVGAVRGSDASWNPAQTPDELRRAVHDNLRNLDLDVLDVVNLRMWGDEGHRPAEGSIEPQFAALAELRQQGLIRHLGLSNVTAAQVAEAQGIAPVVCVQNHYNPGCRYLVIDFGTSKSPKSTRLRDSYCCPGRPASVPAQDVLVGKPCARTPTMAGRRFGCACMLPPPATGLSPLRHLRQHARTLRLPGTTRLVLRTSLAGSARASRR